MVAADEFPPCVIVSNAELDRAPRVGVTVTCETCDAQHVVEHAVVTSTTIGQRTYGLSFYRCPQTGGAYVCGIADKAW